MAFLGAMSTSNEPSASTPSSSTITTISDLGRTNSAAELLTLDQQQLLASMQQNAAVTAAANSLAAQVNPNDALNSTALYQQLLAQMQQQNSQPPSLPISPPAQQSAANNDLIQQLTSQLLTNSSLASSIQPQLAALQQQQQTTQTSAFNPNLAALSGMINASPSLLPSLLNANGQPVQSNATSGAAGNPLANLTNQLLMNGAGGAGNQNNLLAVLNLLQTNPLLVQQLASLQQQQQQQQQQNMALFAQLMNNQNAPVAPTSSRVADMNQLAALLQQAQVPSQGVPQQGEQTPKPAYGRLSTQNSSNSLLAGLSGFDSPTSNTALTSHPIATSSQASIPESSTPHMISSANNSSSSINQAAMMTQSASRQASSDRLLNNESVQDHISRLISENEAIVEPNPVLLKRRPYHRQSTSNSITSQTSEIAGSSQNSPGLFHQVPNNRLPTTRSQSMHESQMSLHCGSLTSGQPIVRNPYQQQPQANQPAQQQNNLTCTFCQVKFPTDATLRMHELRCSNKKEQLTKRMLLQKHQSQPQLQWNFLNAQQQQQIYLIQQQQKLLAQKTHQSNIAALVGGGAGVAPDPISINGTSSGRSSVPIGTGTTRGPSVQASPPNSGTAGSPSTGSDNRHPLKKRLLESVAKNSSDAHSTTSSPTSVTPSASTTNSSSMPNIDLHEAQNSPAKIAKLVQDHVKTAYEICLF